MLQYIIISNKMKESAMSDEIRSFGKIIIL